MKSDYDRSKTIFCKTTENYHPLDPPLLICRHINSGINKDESYRMRMYKLYTENMPYPDLSITLVKSVKSFRYTWVVAATLIALPEYYQNRFRLSIGLSVKHHTNVVNHLRCHHLLSEFRHEHQI